MRSSGSAARPTRPRTLVLYIVGAGRSGSTLLEMVLGEHPEIVVSGELRHLWSAGFRRNQTCACGSQFNDCPFWAAVTDTLRNAGMADDEPLAVERSIRERVRVRKLLELTGLRTTTYSGAMRADDLVGQLYAAIADTSGANVVVDSSKSSLMCLLLARNRDIDLRVIHLVRDARGVAFSWAQPKQWLGDPDNKAAEMRTHRIQKSCGDWALANVLADLCRRRASRYTLMRYEDFAARPVASVSQALNELALDELLASGRFSAVVAKPANHSIMGNPIRFATGEVEIRADERWKREMSRRDHLVATVLTLPLLARYRYQLRLRRRPQGAE